MAKKTAKKTPKHLSSWNMFVMKVKAENPNLAFKDVLKLAGKMKKSGTNPEAYVAEKSGNAEKKIKKNMTKKVKGKKGKSKKGKTRGKR